LQNRTKLGKKRISIPRHFLDSRRHLCTILPLIFEERISIAIRNITFQAIKKIDSINVPKLGIYRQKSNRIVRLVSRPLHLKRICRHFDAWSGWRRPPIRENVGLHDGSIFRFRYRLWFWYPAFSFGYPKSGRIALEKSLDLGRRVFLAYDPQIPSHRHAVSSM